MNTIAFALLIGCGSSDFLPYYPADGGARSTEAGPEPPDAGQPDAGADGGGDDAGRVDAGALPPRTDAGRTDTGATPRTDAAQPPDAGAPLPDAGRPDSGRDAGPSVTDSGTAGRVDAGTRDAGCVADRFEPNETTASAVQLASGTGWPFSLYSLTWSEGDVADWFSGEVNAGMVGTFLVHVADDDAATRVELRVRCSRGVVACTGVGATREGLDCVTRRNGAAYLEIGCGSMTPDDLSIRIGLTRGSGSTRCAHDLTAQISRN